MSTEIKVIIGANYGDEGKGGAVDYFTDQFLKNKKNTVVVLSNGGSQRGHTVTLPSGERHVFRHFGSGSFLGAYTYLPKFFIVNPMNWAEEFRHLVGRGTLLQPLFINKDCNLTTPFDMIANQMIENSRGDKRHGSCGVGIWETILRDGITVGEMAAKTDEEKAEYLRFIRDDYFVKRIAWKGVSIDQKWESIIYSPTLINNYIYDFNMMIRNSYFSDDSILEKFDSIIFENGQGLLLDQGQNMAENGKYTTPSYTGLRNPAEIIKKMSSDVDVEVCYISRTYMTRHGAGAFETESNLELISDKPIKEDETNKTHLFQGKLRYGVLEWRPLEDRVVYDFKVFGDPKWELSFFFTHENEVELPFGYKYDYNTYVSDGLTRHDCRSYK